MSLLPIHKTGEATETKKEAEKERGKSGGRECTRKYEGYSSCQKEKKGKATKRYYICFKKKISP